MDAPEADDQIISGIHSREGNNTWRWTAGEATVALKPPPQPTPLHIELVIHDSSPVRNIKVMAEGHTLLRAYV